MQGHRVCVDLSFDYCERREAKHWSNVVQTTLWFQSSFKSYGSKS